MPFSPADLNGLAAWWKADTVALADGATVTTWPDSSGNGLDLTAVGAPIYKTAGLNNQPTVRLPGTATNYLKNDSINLAQPCTAFFAARRTAASGAVGAIVAGSPTVDVSLFINAGQTFGAFAGGVGGLTAAAASATVAHVFAVVLNGASSTVGVDALGSTFNIGANGFTAGITVGARANRTGEFFDGDVGEICLYTGALGATQATALLTYLGSKYGAAVQKSRLLGLF